MLRTRTAVAIALMVATASAAFAHETAPKAAVQAGSLPVSARNAAATVDAFHAALHRSDARSAAALLADDALIFESGGVERTKAEYAAHHLPADATFSRAVSTEITHRAGGSNGAFAWIASEGRTTGSYKGKALDLLTTETMILRREGRGWKITHIHWSSATKR